MAPTVLDEYMKQRQHRMITKKNLYCTIIYLRISTLSVSYMHTHKHTSTGTHTMNTQYILVAIYVSCRPEPILLFFFLTYFSFQQFFFFLTYFAQYFAHYPAIFLLIKGFFLVYLQLLSMHDCSIRVIHYMVTALLDYLDLLAVFPVAHVDLILFVTILVEYLHLCNAK